MTVLRRVGQYALVLWAAVTLNFALPHLAPGDPVGYLYGGDQQSLDPVYLEQIRVGYGLDRPIFEQYVSFWSGLLHGDLHRPPGGTFARRHRRGTGRIGHVHSQSPR